MGGILVATEIKSAKIATCRSTVIMIELYLSRLIDASRRRLASSSAAWRASISSLEKETFGRAMGSFDPPADLSASTIAGAAAVGGGGDVLSTSSSISSAERATGAGANVAAICCSICC